MALAFKVPLAHTQIPTRIAHTIFTQNPLKGHYDAYFFLCAGIMGLVFVLHIFWVSRRYQEKPIVEGGSRKVRSCCCSWVVCRPVCAVCVQGQAIALFILAVASLPGEAHRGGRQPQGVL